MLGSILRALFIHTFEMLNRVNIFVNSVSIHRIVMYNYINALFIYFG